jgi:hypothetical protein
MALAIRMQDLIRAGGIADYSALAQLGHVSRARISQIMNLLLLAPDIQEQILFLSPSRGRDPIHLAELQTMSLTLDWDRQRHLWAALARKRMEHDSPEKPGCHDAAAARAKPVTQEQQPFPDRQPA